MSLIPEINNPETSPNHEILTPLYSIKPNGSTIAMECAYAEAVSDDFIVDYWSAYNFKEINGKTFCVVKQNGRIEDYIYENFKNSHLNQFIQYKGFNF